MYSLYIEYRDNTNKIVTGVEDFGFNTDIGHFYYIKNGRRSFIPLDVVKFFGDERDYN